jgi:hypothetical protein
MGEIPRRRLSLDVGRHPSWMTSYPPMPPPRDERAYRPRVGVAGRVLCVVAVGLWLSTILAFFLPSTSPADGVNIGAGILGLLAQASTNVAIVLVVNDRSAPPWH